MIGMDLARTKVTVDPMAPLAAAKMAATKLVRDNHATERTVLDTIPDVATINKMKKEELRLIGRILDRAFEERVLAMQAANRRDPPPPQDDDDAAPADMPAQARPPHIATYRQVLKQVLQEHQQRLAPPPPLEEQQSVAAQRAGPAAAAPPAPRSGRRQPSSSRSRRQPPPPPLLLSRQGGGAVDTDAAPASTRPVRLRRPPVRLREEDASDGDGDGDGDGDVILAPVPVQVPLPQPFAPPVPPSPPSPPSPPPPVIVDVLLLRLEMKLIDIDIAATADEIFDIINRDAAILTPRPKFNAEARLCAAGDQTGRRAEKQAESDRRHLRLPALQDLFLKECLKAWFQPSSFDSDATRAGKKSEVVMTAKVMDKIGAATDGDIILSSVSTTGFLINREVPCIGATVDNIATGSIGALSGMIVIEHKAKVKEKTVQSFNASLASKRVKKYEKFELRWENSDNEWERFATSLPLLWRTQILQHLVCAETDLGAIVVADLDTNILHVSAVVVDAEFRLGYKATMGTVFRNIFPWIGDPDVPVPDAVPTNTVCVDRHTLCYNLQLRRALLQRIGSACCGPIRDMLPLVCHQWNRRKGGVDTETKKVRGSKAIISHCGVLAYIITHRLPSHIVSTVHTFMNLIMNDAAIRAATKLGEIRQLLRQGRLRRTMCLVRRFLLRAGSDSQPRPSAGPSPAAPPTIDRSQGKKRGYGDRQEEEEQDAKATRKSQPFLLHIPHPSHLATKRGALARLDQKTYRVGCDICRRPTSWYCITCNQFICGIETELLPHFLRIFKETYPDRPLPLVSTLPPSVNLRCTYLYHILDSLPQSDKELVDMVLNAGPNMIVPTEYRGYRLLAAHAAHAAQHATPQQQQASQQQHGPAGPANLDTPQQPASHQQSRGGRGSGAADQRRHN
jgi:hypothetical protein